MSAEKEIHYTRIDSIFLLLRIREKKFLKSRKRIQNIAMKTERKNKMNLKMKKQFKILPKENKKL